MTTESKNADAAIRKQGHSFTMDEQPVESMSESRESKTFSLDENEVTSELPESITAGERLPHVSEYSGIRLEALPLKGLKPFLFTLAFLFVALLAWEIFSVFMSAMNIHWAIAVAYVFLLSIVTGLGLHLLWGYLSDKQNLSVLEGIQGRAARLREGHDFGNAKSFVNELKGFYADKPQSVYFQQCMEQIPDYSNDKEVIEHINRVFLHPLDREAEKRISDFSMQTATAVALSPWAALDMGLALWRSMTMIDNVAQVYGMRPSLSNRYKLLKLVVQQLVFVGGSEILIDQLIDEMGVSALTGVVSTRLSQGLGAGIYSAKIGLAAMAVSRPLEFTNDDKPKMKHLIAPVVARVKGLFKRNV